MRKKYQILSLFMILALVLSCTAASVFAASEGTPGGKPLDYIGAYLTTISDNTSTTGESIEGNAAVPLKPLIKVHVDKNIAADNVWPNNQNCFFLKDAAGVNVPISVSRIDPTVNFSERQHAFITPINDLKPGTAYQLVVTNDITAANTGVKMAYTKTIDFTTIGEAADASAPVWGSGSTLTVSNITQTGVNLNWTAASDNKEVTSYKVYNGSTLVATVTGTSYNVTGLTAGTAYTFKVEAGDAAGNWTTNGPSKDVTTTAPATGADASAPVWGSDSLNVSDINQTYVKLSWTAATDNQTVTRYRIYRNGTLLTTVTGTSAMVTSLTPGTQYTFRIEAGDAAGNWTGDGPGKTITTTGTAPVNPPTNKPEDTSTGQDSIAPVWPGGSTLNVSSVKQKYVTLSWSAATDNKRVTGYKIYRNGKLLATVWDTKCMVTGLTPGTQYTFKVEAGDAAGNWTGSGPFKVITTLR